MKNIVFAMILLFSAVPSSAKKYYFRHYQNDQGLSQNTVVACMQDKRGFMWFGTRNGLNRFDGVNFKKYFSNESANSLSNNSIMSLKEDRQGLIWIGTFRGLCYYNPQTDIFRNFEIKGKAIKDVIRDVKTDLQDNIWFATLRGLYRYNKTKKQVLFFPSKDFFVPNKILVTRNGEIWITSSNGKIYKYFENDTSFQGYPILTKAELKESLSINTAIEDNKQMILIATTKAGVRLFDPISKAVTCLFNTNDEGLEMVVNAMLITKSNELWIGASNGLYKYSTSKGLSHAIRNDAGDPFSISDNGVFALWEDNENGIWACTYYGGINYLPHENTLFEKYIPSSVPGYIQGKVIRAIISDATGRIWIGSEDQGLSSYTPITDSFKNYPFHQNIRSLLLQGTQLWMGTSEHGIYSLNLNSNKITPLQFKGLKSNSINSFLKTDYGTIFVGAYNGLYKYLPKVNDMVKIESVDFNNVGVACMCENIKGELLIGTYSNGLYVYKGDRQKITHYEYDDDNQTSISSDFITSIYEDSKHRIWITTEGGGLCKFNSNHTFTRYRQKDGLPSAITCAVHEDAKGMLWISTTEGLVRYNPNLQKMDVFDTGNGLLDNNFSYNSCYVDENGKMYFGTIKGMIAFNPFEIRENKFTPQVYITGIHDLDSEEEKTEKGKSILETRKITLPYNKSSFSIDFVAPSYTNPMLSKYRYKLQGVDNDWHYLTHYRRIYYTNVEPGSYELKIAVKDASDNWNTHETSMKIRISPPIWNSFAAHLLYLILIISTGVYSYRRYAQKKKRIHEHIIEELNNQKEKELFNSKIQFFTNITHEVRTPLTLIKIPLDKIIEMENIPDLIKENLHIMKRNVDRLLDLINQLLDFRKTEMDMLKLNYMREDVNTLVMNIVERFRPSVEDQNKTLIFHRSEHPIELAVDKEIITKIISNLLTNALKYSKDVIEVFVEESDKDDQETFIRVNSNGPIIPENLHEKIFEPFFQIEQNPAIHTKKGSGLGLSLARSLADLHHGKLFVDDHVKDMNSFLLVLSNQIEENVKVKSEKGNILEDKMTQYVESADGLHPVILVVDDEKEMAQFIAKELSSDYNVILAFDGKQAMEILNNEQVSLVVSDVLMPEMDGYALCNYIKSTPDFCHIPVILLTASVAINSRIVGLESGADGYIEKPFTMNLLKGQIDNIFRNKELACKNFINSPLSNYRAVALNNMDEDFMKKLHAVILANMSDTDFKVEKLTELMNMSRSSLFRKIKAITDLAPNEYIRLYKLKKAAELLVEGRYKINEVAYITGFSSQSYFTISFQKQFNLSPTEFIKQQKNS